MQASSSPHRILASFPVFHGLPPDDLSAVAAVFEEKTIPQGRDLYRQGETGRYFYIVVDGAISLWRRKGDEEEQVTLLGPGEAFGEDSLAEPSVRLHSACAETDAIVLRAAADPLRVLLARLPGAEDSLRVILRGRRLLSSVRFPWLVPEEAVCLATRKAEALLAPGLTLPVLLAAAGLAGIPILLHLAWPSWTLVLPAACLLAALALAAWQAIDWGNDYYLVTNRRVVVIRRIPFIYDDRKETPLDRIQSIAVTRTVFQRMFGFGDVVIRTFTRPIVLDSVPDPHTIARLLDAVWKIKRSCDTDDEKEEIARLLAERLNPRPPSETGSETPVPSPADTADSGREEAQETQGRLQTRYESGDTVTYRKHAFFLVRNSFLPILLILFGINLAAVIAVGVLPFDRLLGVLAGIGISLGGVAWTVYEYLDWSNDVYQVTGDQILSVHRKPLGEETRRAAALDNILNLEYDRPSLLARMLNFGTVKATVGQVTFTFDEVSDPVHVQEDIFRRMDARRKHGEARQRKERRDEIADWISAYHDIARGQDSNEKGESV